VERTPSEEIRQLIADLKMDDEILLDDEEENVQGISGEEELPCKLVKLSYEQLMLAMTYDLSIVLNEEVSYAEMLSELHTLSLILDLFQLLIHIDTFAATEVEGVAVKAPVGFLDCLNREYDQDEGTACKSSLAFTKLGRNLC
jgi:hypothetical protein